MTHPKDHSPSPPAPPRRSQRRILRKLMTALTASLVLALTFRVYIHELTGVPTYEELKRHERRLPQHNLDLPFPEGRHGRYVKFVPYAGYGWNNELQDIIMVSQIALLADRGYVFQPYIWSQNPFTPVVPKLDWGFRSSRIPLNAFIGGPISGNEPWTVVNSDHSQSRNDSAAPPRSVSYEWWDVVCPPERRVLVDVHETRKELGIEWGAPVRDIIERWADKLRAMNDTCVEVTGDRVFTFFDYGEKRLLSAWDVLSTSPVLSQLTWSPFVNRILHRNLPLLQSQPSPPSSSSPSTGVSRDVIDGLLAVHIRRGDFQRHCLDRLKYSSEYNGWNSFPDYPDVFDPPSADSNARAESYEKHCYPSLDHIVDRINLVREQWFAQTGKNLDRVYVMTNAKGDFLNDLRRRLTDPTTAADATPSWKSVVTTNDLSVPLYSKELVSFPYYYIPA
ncbi:hypothetical protein FRB90_008935 [Tulasnella sp. 427]|nr:hypothetical protein FRB90_008935 [Tulasnella sp. 427]